MSGIWVFNSGDERHYSHTLPRYWSVPDPSRPGRRIPLAKHYDEDGRPGFASQREIREAIAKAQDLGEPVIYERGFVRYGRS